MFIYLFSPPRTSSSRRASEVRRHTHVTSTFKIGTIQKRCRRNIVCGKQHMRMPQSEWAEERRGTKWAGSRTSRDRPTPPALELLSGWRERSLFREHWFLRLAGRPIPSSVVVIFRQPFMPKSWTSWTPDIYSLTISRKMYHEVHVFAWLNIITSLHSL